jgi:hypothetical protein
MIKKPIYISGPITGVEYYQDSFLYCEKWLNTEGKYEPVNPAFLVPFMLRNYNIKHPEYNDYMKCALILMIRDNCRDIILLPRWQYSKGACIELLYAKFFGYRVHLFFENIVNGSKRILLRDA